MDRYRMCIAALAFLLAAGCDTQFKPAGDAAEDMDAVDEEVGGDVPVEVPDGVDVSDPTGDPDEDPVVDPADDPVTDPTTDPTTDPVDDLMDVVTDVVVEVDDAMDAEAEPVPCVDPIVDGEFQTTTGWTTSGTAVVDTTASGYGASGEGQLPRTAVCALDEISQSVSSIPPITSCGPARLVAHARETGGSSMDRSQLGVSIAGNWKDFGSIYSTSTWQDVTSCLGEGAYSGSARIAYAASAPPRDCEYAPSDVHGLAVDSVEITFDPTCPDIGEVINGDFEDGTGFGWSLQASTHSIAEADASGIGVSGSYAGRLYIDQRCESASMWAPMSVPLSGTMASPALSYQMSLTPSENPYLTMENLPSLILSSTSTVFREVRVCLPHFMAGGVYGVGFAHGYSGTCGAAVGPLELIVDNLRLVNDTTCVFSSGMLDPGFEASRSDNLRYGWAFQANAGGSGGNPEAEAISDATEARTGNGVGHLSVDQHCDGASMRQAIEVPSPSGSSGPAVILWYRYPVDTVTSMGFSVTGFGGSSIGWASATATSSWTQQVVCIAPEFAGRPGILEVGMGSAGSCAVYFTAEHAWFDDFQVTTHSSCPAT